MYGKPDLIYIKQWDQAKDAVWVTLKKRKNSINRLKYKCIHGKNKGIPTPLMEYTNYCDHQCFITKNLLMILLNDKHEKLKFEAYFGHNLIEWYSFSSYMYRVEQKKVYTCMLHTLTSHKSHFLLIFDGKTYINEKVIHERVYFSVCPP